MSEYGLQESGDFDAKKVDDVIDDLIVEMRARAGNNIDVHQGSSLKQILDAIALEVTRQWETSEGIYYSSFYEDSYGIQLDKILSIAGITRIPRRGATGEIELIAEPPNAEDKTILAGAKVASEATQDIPSIEFRTTEDVILEHDPSKERNSVTVPIRALPPSETDVDVEFLGEDTNIAANAITKRVSNMPGVDKVTNPHPTGDTSYGYTKGREREEDPELKLRYRNTLGTGGDATIEAIRSEIFGYSPDIYNVNIEENYTMEDRTASGGLPPKSFRATVLGGTAAQIAQAITDSRAAGIEPYGDICAMGEISDGDTFRACFQRADQIDVTVQADIYVDDTYRKSGGADSIRNGIIEYVGGKDTFGLELPGTGIGSDVLYDQIFAKIMDEPGVKEVDFQIAGDGSLSKENIVIQATETGRISSSNINIDTYDYNDSTR